MPRKFFQDKLPTAESIRANRWLGWLGPFLDKPGLWRLNRRSVAGAVAIGMFSGLVPGPLQMITAALLAVPLKRNLPVALAVTLYTNPFTIVPLYVLAYGYGRLIVGGDGDTIPEPYEIDWTRLYDSMLGLGAWMLSLGKPLAIGLVALALTLAALGYLVVDVGWRIRVILAWRARRSRRTGGA
ncbi:MAG: DUF2062 domain-containing protein [Betaproteobacteria bacterium]|nr:DUF2062 domain-containing protein [Betaproteobacteria bacterium]